MVNDLVTTPLAGTGGYAVHADLELRSLEWDGKRHLGTVQSRLTADPICPQCGSARRVNTVAVANFRDIPKDGQPVRLAWKRRLFVCPQCSRPSVETHPAFDERHYVTRRLLDWIFLQSGQRPLAEIAGEVGVSQKWVSQLLGRVDAVRESARQPSTKRIAYELVRVFGPLRPVVIDIDTRRVLDVFPSTEALVLELKRRAIAPTPADRQVEAVVRDAELESCSDDLRCLYSEAALYVSPASMIRAATAMMEEAASGAIAEQAAREGKAAMTGRILFARRDEKLGRNGKRRLVRWREQAPFLGAAYDTKELFIEYWTKNRVDQWREWADGAKWLVGIDYDPVIALVERNLEGLKGYIREASEKLGFAGYRATVDAIAGLELEGVRSFAGARAAVLSKFPGKAPGSAANSNVPDGAGAS